MSTEPVTQPQSRRDHGWQSCGARGCCRQSHPGQVRSFGVRFIHHVVNHSSAPAVSVHAYSPPLPPMRRYALT